MAEQLVLSPVLQVVLDKLASPVIEQFANMWNVKNNIQKLQPTLPIIQAILEDTEEKHANDTAVGIWLSNLKDVAYDTLYLLLDYSHVSYCTSAEKVKRMIFELEMATDKVLDLNLWEDHPIQREWDKRETSYSINEYEVYGRKEDKDNIVDLLLLSCESTQRGEVSCITIEGMIGLGKTTLAQLAYTDQKVTQHFDVKVWVFVSHHFDAKNILMTIIESTTEDKCHVSNMAALHSTVEQLLYNKRYLIVLDDVWTENQDDWEKLRPLFGGGINGSKILITTQTTCFSTRRRRKVPNSLAYWTTDIFRKCVGVALAAKSLGSLLRFKKKETEWLYVRDNELWNLEEGESGIIRALRLIYSRLPRYLRRCFAFCSIFPRGFEIKKENLIYLWMAEGLIQSNVGSKLPEDIGNDYFNDLLWMSFFEEVKQRDDGIVTGYKMHDVIYNLARFVAKSEYTILDSEFPRERSFAKIRHSSVVFDLNSSVIPTKLYEAKGLMTLLLFSGGNLNKVPRNLFSSFKYLFALDLSGSGLEVLEGPIWHLIHLKYLDLSNTLIRELPRQIETLFHLQTLNLSQCHNLIALPNLLAMKNIRYLNNAGCEALTTMFPVFDNSFHSFIIDVRERHICQGQYVLQKLPLFVVGESYEMNLLGQLNLRDSLKITHLENVRDSVYAWNAQLMQKEGIESLGLYWGSDDHRSNINPEEEPVVLSRFQKGKQAHPSEKLFEDQQPESSDSLAAEDVRVPLGSLAEDVLKNLQPHQNLKRLLIEGYPGIKFPQWNVLYLSVVHLIGCRSEYLPVLGHLQFLRSLLLQEMHGVKNIDKDFFGKGTEGSFPALKELVLIDFPSLEEWSSPAAAKAFPSWSKLIVNNCPQLIELPVPLSIQHLELHDCKATIVHSFRDLNSLKTLVISRVQDLFDFPGAFPGNNPLLTSLEIKSCYQLSVLPPELENLTSLKSLTIRWCQELSYLPLGLQNLTALETFEIGDCPNLIYFPNIRTGGLSSLRTLSIENCNNLTSLPSGLQFVTSLEHLTIMYCSSLGMLPRGVEHLSTLRSLTIINCEKLTSLPEGLQNLNALHSLEIRSCPGLQALPDWIERLVSLRSLSISGCENITFLPEGLKCLTALQHLSIQDCPPNLLERCNKVEKIG